jgi:hypothetical protein
MKKIMCIFIALFLAGIAYTQEFLVVKTEVCILRLDRTNGNLVGLHWINPDEEIIKESLLGENFRILFPLPEYDANYFLGTNQKIRIEKPHNGIFCHYNKMTIKRVTIRLKVDQKIEFYLCLNNFNT